MRFFAGIVVGLALAASLPLVAQAADDPAAPASPPALEAVDVDQLTVPAPAGDATAQPQGSAARADDPAHLVAELPARRVGDFGLVGVTWSRGSDDTDLVVQVRLRVSGSWGTWEELHVDSDGGDVGRDGTEPLWAGDADGIAVRVTSPTGRRPAGLAVSTIDPGSTAASSSMAAAQVAPTAATYTARPSIVSRSAWGARKNTYCDSPRTGNETRGVVVHHTAGSNSYSRDESSAVVRAVQAFHMDGRDWCDIGYNFLVVRFGRIFEGRNGGVDKPVRAAHSGSTTVNTYTMGVAMMGTFSSREPSSETKDAMVRLISWRIGTTFHPAEGIYGVGARRLERISGHRDVVATSCPGDAAYAWLSADGGLRNLVAERVAAYSSDVEELYRSLTAAVTGPVFVGEYGFSAGGGGHKARMAKVDIYSSPSGTFSVGDVVRSRYATVGGLTGSLGVPTSGVTSTARSTLTLQRFARGTIYRVERTSTAAFALWGSMEDRYRSLGEAQGVLGAPTRTQTRISGGRSRAWFVHGHLTRQVDGTVSVSMG